MFAQHPSLKGAVFNPCSHGDSGNYRISQVTPPCRPACICPGLGMREIQVTTNLSFKNFGRSKKRESVSSGCPHPMIWREGTGDSHADQAAEGADAERTKGSDTQNARRRGRREKLGVCLVPIKPEAQPRCCPWSLTPNIFTVSLLLCFTEFEVSLCYWKSRVPAAVYKAKNVILVLKAILDLESPGWPGVGVHPQRGDRGTNPQGWDSYSLYFFCSACLSYEQITPKK